VLFASALEQPTEQRAAYVRGASPNPAVEIEVLSLLQAHERRGRLDSLTDQLRGLSAATASLSGPVLAARLARGLAGRYRIGHEIGRGGMAIVFLAEDLKHHRRVALKVLHPGLALGLGAPRFLQEIAIAAQLAHPHILPLHDSGEVDGLLYYVMPYVEGESLRERLRRERRIPLGDALTIAREVADALCYAHGRGVVHRDVKPENILFLAGHAVVSDFGIAWAMTAAGADQVSETGVILGTPAYMSPEQSVGGKAVDGRSDVYSLGCVLYEMLTGAPPFCEDGAEAILARKTKEPAPPIRAVQPDVPEAAERALSRALSAEPAGRYASASQFADDLSHLRAARPARDRRSFAAVVVALGLLLAGIGGYFRLHEPGTSPAPIRSLAVLPLENLMGDSTQEYFVAGMQEALIGELGRVGVLNVISRTSVMRYDSTRAPLPQIARELHVQALVEGSILRAGTKVRIAVRLVQAVPEERQLWSQTYEGTLRNVIALQRSVAQAIATELGVTVLAARQARGASPHPVNPDAHILYLKGNFELELGTASGFGQALEHYQQAITVDSSYAPAYAGLATAYIELGSWMGSLAPGVVRAQARAAAMKAIALDSTLAEAHIALARIMHLFEWDWAGAEAEFRRGIALNPSETYARVIYANYLISMGRSEEALATAREAAARDPLSPQAAIHVAFALHYLGRYGEADLEDRRSVELAPHQADPELGFAENDLKTGRLDDAYRHAARADSLLGTSGSTTWMCRLGYIYGRLGRRADALRVLRAVRARDGKEYIPPFALAAIYVGLGQRTKALDLLDRAYLERDVRLVWLKAHEYFEPLRDEPRFQDLVRRMGFPAGSSK
jgi:serine/threonine-protein kinase